MRSRFTDADLQLLLRQGLSQAEMARQLGVTEQAVSSRVKRLKAKLADRFLEEVGPDPVSLKEQLTPRELKFIENHLVLGMTIERAMLQAGYQGYHQKSLYRSAKRIIAKYEQQGPGHRTIMRTLGVGEITIITEMFKLAQTAKSAATRVHALTTLGRWIGLEDKPTEQPEGITVIIQGPHEGQGQPVTPQASAYPHRLPGVHSGKPIQISE